MIWPLCLVIRRFCSAEFSVRLATCFITFLSFLTSSWIPFVVVVVVVLGALVVVVVLVVVGVMVVMVGAIVVVVVFR